jgi:hypothetical protein
MVPFGLQEVVGSFLTQSKVLWAFAKSMAQWVTSIPVLCLIPPCEAYLIERTQICVRNLVAKYNGCYSHATHEEI